MKTRTTISGVTGLVLLAVLAGFARADEKDLFDAEKQKAAGKDVKKIVFIADAGRHGGRGNHEFVAGSILMAREINAAYPKAYAVVHSSKNWPKDLSHADSIIVLLNHGGRAAKDPNIAKAAKRGAGFAAIHYGVEVNKGEQGNNFLEWMGGYFEKHWSVNPHWDADITEIPKHPVSRGVKPFAVRDEWYYHMRFQEDMKNVTPILSALPPLKTCQGNGARSGNEAVRAEVKAGKKQHLAWAYDRPDGARGFGFTGLHFHKNLAEDGFRIVLLNGVAWVTKLEIPEGGVPSKTPSKEQLEKVIDEARDAVKNGK